MIVGLVGILGLGMAVAVPAIKSSLYERVVVKGNEEGGALYHQAAGLGRVL